MKQIIQMNIPWLKIPPGRRQTSWLFTNITEELNSGLLRNGSSWWSARQRDPRFLVFDSLARLPDCKTLDRLCYRQLEICDVLTDSQQAPPQPSMQGQMKTWSYCCIMDPLSNVFPNESYCHSVADPNLELRERGRFFCLA